MTDAKAGYGTLLKVGDGGSPETFTTIAEVKNITPPQIARDSLDATNQDTPDGYREFVGGLADGGAVSFDCNYIPGNATQADLLAKIHANENHNWQVVLPTTPSATWSFSGFVQNYNPAAPIDGLLGLSVTIKVSGKPTLA